MQGVNVVFSIGRRIRRFLLIDISRDIAISICW